MRYLTLGEVVCLHKRIVETSGGAIGIRDLAALESALAQPKLTFDRQDLYPTAEAKGTSLCFAIVLGHPFVDGNKRVGHAAMEAFLLLNGFELCADVDEQERIMLSVAAGATTREELLDWIQAHTSKSSHDETRRMSE